MCDLENSIALHIMQENWASYLSEEEVSWFFSSCGGNLGYILELWLGCPFKTHFCSAISGLQSSYDGKLRNISQAWQYNTDATGSEAGNRGSLSSWQSDIVIPINFQEVSGIVTF